MTSSYRIVVICEGSGDRDVAEGLTQSVLAQLVNWETTGLIAFRGLELNEGFSTWGGLPERAKGRVPRRNGFREAFTLDAFATWRALKLASTPEVDADGVILLRDSDKESERRSSIEAGVREFTANNKTKIRIAIGVATAKIEAWLISALDSDSDARRALRKELGFDVALSANVSETATRGAIYCAGRWSCLRCSRVIEKQ